MKRYIGFLLLLVSIAVAAFAPLKKKPVKIYLIGDSTVADYTEDYDDKDYMTTRYPIAGWGQVFQPFMRADSLFKIRNIIKVTVWL